MDPTFFAQYQGFEFHCSPLRMPGGGFIPQLRVSADFGATRVELPVPAPVLSQYARAGKVSR